MKFESALTKGTLIKRYKRFLADIILESGEEITAHCANTGSMKTCGKEGDTVWLSYHPSPKRKLPYSWEFTEVENGYVGINTALPNKLVYEAIESGSIKELRGYDILKREVKYGEKSRIDIYLEDSKSILKPCYVEVKNVTLLGDDCILFPDAVTTRGQKHLDELATMVDKGYRSVMFYLVNRPEGDYFKIADHIDPDYKAKLVAAKEKGVELLAYRASSDLKTYNVTDSVKIKL